MKTNREEHCPVRLYDQRNSFAFSWFTKHLVSFCTSKWSFIPVTTQRSAGVDCWSALIHLIRSLLAAGGRLWNANKDSSVIRVVVCLGNLAWRPTEPILQHTASKPSTWTYVELKLRFDARTVLFVCHANWFPFRLSRAFGLGWGAGAVGFLLIRTLGMSLLQQEVAADFCGWWASADLAVFASQ